MSNRHIGQHAGGWPDEDGYLDDPELDEFDGPEFDGAEFDGAGFDAAGFDAAGLDGAELDEAELPYPLTYERDGVADPDSVQADGATGPWATGPELAEEGDGPGNFQSWRFSSPPLADGRGGAGAAPAFHPADGQAYDEPWITGARASRPRWLIPAVVAVAAAVLGTGAVVLLTGGHSGAAPVAAGRTASAAASSAATSAATSGASAAVSPMANRTTAPSTAAGTAPPLTLAAARQVLAAYTAANNTANAARNAAELATVETGGSDAIDATSYALQQAAGAKPFPAFAPVSATYYIPRSEAAGGTRWFAVLVANAFSTAPKKVTSTEYLLFTQAAAGAPWRNTVEPYLLAGATAPQIAIGADGLATAVSLTAPSLAAVPGQLATLTAGSMDGVGGGVFVSTVSPVLIDRVDQKFWRGKLPGTRVHDAHAAAAGTAGQTFALRTASGGALVFYTDSAEVTFTPPAGTTVRLNIPGLYSPNQPLASARLSYLDQLAAYDPPAGAGAATVIGSYSGVTGKN